MMINGKDTMLKTGYMIADFWLPQFLSNPHQILKVLEPFMYSLIFFHLLPFIFSVADWSKIDFWDGVIW